MDKNLTDKEVKKISRNKVEVRAPNRTRNIQIKKGTEGYVEVHDEQRKNLRNEKFPSEGVQSRAEIRSEFVRVELQQVEKSIALPELPNGQR